MHNRQQKLLDYLRLYGSISNSEAQSITGAHRNTISLDFKKLLQEGVLYSEGTKKSTRYFLKSEKLFPAAFVSKLRKLPTIHAYFNANNQKKVFFVQTHEPALQAKLYFDDDIEDRFRQCLPQINNKRQQLSHEERKRRKERLTIDLAWASSSIEGSTYSLLETEALILHHQTAQGKQLNEAKMIMNHKNALGYMLDLPVEPLSKHRVFELHQILMEGLSINTGIREGMVRISHSRYVPCDNRFQIEEYLDRILATINQADSVLEKVLRANLLIAYLQPFVDGNKRTSRMLGNLILVQHGYVPVSFSHTPKEEYLKSIILFYEKQSSDYFKYHLLVEIESAYREYLV